MDDFRHFDVFQSIPAELDKDGAGGVPPELDNVRITHQGSALEEGGIWKYPEADAWPDSVFSTAEEIGESQLTEVGQSVADKAERDMAYGRLIQPPRWWNDFRLISNSPAGTSGQQAFVIKPSMAILHSILPSLAGTNWVVNFFDGNNPGGQPIFRYLTAMGLTPIILDIKVQQALVVTATGTAGELVITYL